jgi:hypothetical protein
MPQEKIVNMCKCKGPYNSCKNRRTRKSSFHAHLLIIILLCAMFRPNPTRNVVEVAFTNVLKTDRRMDGQTDGQKGVKQYVSSWYTWGDIIFNSIQ